MGVPIINIYHLPALSFFIIRSVLIAWTTLCVFLSFILCSDNVAMFAMKEEQNVFQENNGKSRKQFPSPILLAEIMECQDVPLKYKRGCTVMLVAVVLLL